MSIDYKPKNIVFEVTSECNNDCVYCYNVWKSPHKTYPVAQMPFSDIIKIIDELLNEIPLQSVSISGGEPFLRADLSQIVSYLWSRNINSVIVTNGTLLTKENIERTCGTNNYEIPLLSYRKAIHNKLTQRDCFDNVIEGMHNVKMAGAHFTVAFVATQINYKDLQKTIELAIALGAEGFLYNRMNVGAHNYHNIKSLLPSIDMLKENLDVLEAFGESYGIPISCAIPMQPCLINMDQYKHVYSGFCPLAGKNDVENAYFTVDPAGNLRVCNHSAFILGNLLENKFIDLIRHPFVQQFRKTIPKDCVSCPPEFLDYCHGGCKAAAEVCYDSLEISEPFLQCYLQERKIPRRAN